MLNRDALKRHIVEGRTRLGLEPKEMADRLGIQLPVYRQYENGFRSPGAEMLAILADQFGTTVDYLISE